MSMKTPVLVVFVALLTQACASRTQAPISVLSTPTPKPGASAVVSAPLQQSTGNKLVLPPAPPGMQLPPVPEEVEPVYLPAPTPAPAPMPQATAQRKPVRQPASSTQYYTIRSGDTLHSIARRFEVSVAQLVKDNQLRDAARIKAGDRLVIRSTVASTKPNATVAAPKAQTAAPQSHAVRTQGNIRWSWPLNGKVVQAFTPALRGIGIEGRLGEPVRAVADGKVVHLDHGTLGLGNVLLVEHPNGYLSVYAYNQKLYVKKDQKVRRGDTIAAVGKKGQVSQLHFEIRLNGEPINPINYLPKR